MWRRFSLPWLPLPRAVKRTLAARLHAVLLLVSFAGGGLGLPAVDQVLYHADGNAAAGLVGIDHFDSAGGCGSHAEHCLLPRFASVRPHPSVDQPVLRFELVADVDPSLRPVASLRSLDRSLLQPSRAPPVAAS